MLRSILAVLGGTATLTAGALNAMIDFRDRAVTRTWIALMVLAAPAAWGGGLLFVARANRMVEL